MFKLVNPTKSERLMIYVFTGFMCSSRVNDKVKMRCDNELIEKVGRLMSQCWKTIMLPSKTKS